MERMLRLLTALLLLVALLLSSALSLRITLDDDTEVYSGPGGTVAPQFKSAKNAFLFDFYTSTVQFAVSSNAFAMVYTGNVLEVFSEPTARVVEDNGVLDPYIFGDDGYTFDGSSVQYWLEQPEIGVFFNCRKEGTATVELTIETAIIISQDGESHTTEETIKIYLAKDCQLTSSGFRDGFVIGYEEGREDDVVRHGVVQNRWSVESDYFLDKNPVVVPESEHFSSFRIGMLSRQYGNQFFYPPSISVSDEAIAHVWARGSAEHGGIATTLSDTLILFCDCYEDGEVEVMVSIHLGYYGTIYFGFIKECRAEDDSDEENPEAGTINVGLTLDDFSGIVSKSITSFDWSTEGPSVLIDVDEFSTGFYVSTESGSSQTVLQPIVSVHPSTAFSYTVSGSLRSGGVVSGHPQRFVINYLCDRVSEAIVIVSIKLPGHPAVEFAYQKKCKALIRHTDHVWTANQVFFILILASLVIGGVLFILFKKKKQAEMKLPHR